MSAINTLSITVFVFFCFINTVSGQNKEQEHKAIKKVVNQYLVGDTQKQFDTLKMAFHENAMMKYVSSKSGYQEYNALEVFKGDIGREPEKNRANEINYVDVTGRAASVKVTVTYPDRVVVDYVNLLKIDGRWKIVSKIFSLKN
ncbi:nuclear transport factor 2 family protein [Spongiivirga sp. MCCC 1A20706]|uniref:nuclear transport factor 2 family protein n=1 Tax=Spongiivirga sp. MCCC 1A20706 TaxID=3160963 RepID=UPI003977441F